jgi:hypothetical protein
MIVILNARAVTAAKSGNLQSRIAELFCAAGLNAEISTGPASGSCSSGYPHLSRSPLSDRRYRRPRGLFWLVFYWTAFETLHWRRY